MHTQVSSATLIGCGVEESPAKEIGKHLFTEFTQPECWEVFPELRQFLREVKGRGLSVGIISNFDQRLGTTSNWATFQLW